METPKTTLKTVEEDNSEAVVSVSVGDGESLYITSISASYDNTTSDMTIHVEDGGSVVWKKYIEDDVSVQFDWAVPLKMTEGNDVDVKLSPSGSTGTNGRLNVAYFIGE